MSNSEYNFVAARNEDLYRLPSLLFQNPALVQVRDAFGSMFLLTDHIMAPFTTKIEDGYIVLYAKRIADEQVACLRIIVVGEEKIPCLQWKEQKGDNWKFDRAKIPLYQLYIPDRFVVNSR